MPKNVPIDEFSQINFVTSAAWLGCFPDTRLLLKFAKEPALDLALVLITPDLEDIVKEWLRPATPRYRKPARHGRKKTTIDFIMDPHGTINSSVKQQTRGIYPGVKLPGAKALFLVSDVVDRVNISAFVLEGVTAIGFQSMLGALNYDPRQCPNFAYVHREANEWDVEGGAGGFTNPINFSTLISAQGFFSTGPGSVRYLNGPMRIAASITAMATDTGPVKNYSIAIRHASGGAIIAQNGGVDLEPGESTTLTVDALIGPNVPVYVGHNYDSGFFREGAGTMLAWGDPLW